MKPICTFCSWHLGDSLVWLHALRAIALNSHRDFLHFAPPQYCGQLSPVVEDIHNIRLFSLESAQWKQYKPNAVNTWKAANGYLDKHPNRHDWVRFTLDHHNSLAKRLGSKVRFDRVEQLLFDYPALNPQGIHPGNWFYDLLVINGEPHSGQFSPMAAHGSGYLDEMIKEIARHRKVITTSPVEGVECTVDTRQTVTDIGRLSISCRNHLCVATGPLWATLNTTNNHQNSGRTRIVLIDNGEWLDFPGLLHANSREEAIEIFRREGNL